MKNTLTRKNHIPQIVFGALFFLAFLFICIFFPYFSKADETGYVDASELNVRTGPGTWAPAVGTLSYTTITIVGEAKDAEGDLWYKIKYAGGEYYVYADYVTIQSGTSDDVVYSNSSSSSSFEEQLSAFPESYQKLIRDIHASYPNYIFEADYVNISYDDAVYLESIGHKKLVNMYSDGISWRSLDSGCYNRSSGTWDTYSGDWTDAGIDVIEYYMDPRNFLNTRNMFIFAQQTYSGAETRSGVETIAAGSFLAGNYTDSTGTHSYIDTIMEAAKESNVSPYVIAATIRAEQPTWGQSPLIDGSHGYYNFFNFGASGSDVVGNGIYFAKTQGWDTVYKSILGGAKGYYNGYLKAGQDTYFYKDYNLPNLDFNHQYAQSVYDQIGNAAFLRNAIGSDYNAVLTLRIPVYTEMPLVPQGYPEENGSLNKRYAQDGSVLPRGTQTIAMVPNNTMVTTPPVNDVADDPKKVTEQPATPVEEPTTAPVQEEPTTAPVQTATYSAGDANGDGKISAMDYVAVKNHIMGTKTITDNAKLKAADANGDGKISALDYVRIKNMILGN
ncbi:MAG: SH3 domain-containing protein [Lachnospiraceae bacterium]|nr:SH3 domain-containing protein [Lachnospiraceae bacterium]